MPPATALLTCSVCRCTATRDEALAQGWRFVAYRDAAPVAASTPDAALRYIVHVRCALCALGSVAAFLVAGPRTGPLPPALQTALEHYRAALVRQEMSVPAAPLT